MQIRELSQRTGLPAKTIRYYEEIGLLPPPKRLDNSYRDYSEADVARTRLVAGARRLDLSLYSQRAQSVILPEVTQLESARREYKQWHPCSATQNVRHPTWMPLLLCLFRITRQFLPWKTPPPFDDWAAARREQLHQQALV